jgi:hypothetical protein
VWVWLVPTSHFLAFTRCHIKESFRDHWTGRVLTITAKTTESKEGQEHISEDETIPGMGMERIKENDGGVNSTMMYLIYCKNICKCHNVPSAQQQQ